MAPHSYLGARRLTVNMRPPQRYPWTFILADVSTGILGITFRQFYKLLVDSRGLRLIGFSNIKFTGLKAHTDVHRITGILPDSLDSFHSLMERFPNLTEPIEEINLVTDRVAHHIITKRPPVTA
ncbi:unnamed protein product [Echinostoma caproni]|uniref:DUF4325 domain-containing protein n=1 Tax=Echinostoma caproni TaxID=27848 RepID=A0A183BG10_9TREM|nr:unnamed protein product [Echinostoma caproni]